MAEVLLDDVSRVHRDGTAAVSRLTLHVRDGELMVLLGPSGSGKSTVLRLVAGLDPLAGGSVHIGGRVVDDLPPAERGVAMVFEYGALYPHLTAEQNLRFPLSVRHVDDHEITDRVGAEARVLRLGRFLGRRPRTLSAGERQRVVIGRATVRVPQVFLLDEPLTHLDAGERIRLRTELAAFLRGLGTTTIYVTHDQAQALAVGDRVAVMRSGRVEQVAAPREVYRRPANVFVAGFLGEPGMTLLAGRLESDAGRTWVVLGSQRLPFPGRPTGPLRSRVGGPVTVGLRPEHVTDAGTVGDPAAVLFSTAERVEDRGSLVLVGCPLDTAPVTADGTDPPRAGAVRAELVARFPRAARVRPGDRVELAVDTAELSFFDPVTGEALRDPD